MTAALIFAVGVAGLALGGLLGVLAKGRWASRQADRREQTLLSLLERTEQRCEELTNQLLHAAGRPWAPPPEFTREEVDAAEHAGLLDPTLELPDLDVFAGLPR